MVLAFSIEFFSAYTLKLIKGHVKNNASPTIAAFYGERFSVS